MPTGQVNIRQSIATAFNRVPGRCACAYDLANEVATPELGSDEKLAQIFETLLGLHRERELVRVIEHEDRYFTLFSAPWTLFPFL